METFDMTYTVNLKLENDKLKAKNKKLRDALENVFNELFSVESFRPDYYPELLTKLRDILKEAVKDGE